jgi:perosamine synthetase
MQKTIKLFDPNVGKDEEIALKKTFQSHFWSSGSGNGQVSKFENLYNKYLDSKECIAVNSGSAALHLALSLIDIKNKEVILPSLTFVATANAIVLNGGKPIFVDVDPQTLCIDPEIIRKKITKKTKIILPVHYAGLACDLDTINDLCKKFNLVMIEDAAHATGTLYKNKKIGTHGFAVCHSFNPTKNLVMPTGGAISLNTRNSKKLKIILNSKRWCGISNRKGTKYDVTSVGWNYFMNEFSATMGIEQLKKLEKLIIKKKKIARRYANEINLTEKMAFDKNCSYHIYWIRVKNRKGFMKSMLNYNIETGIHYQPIHTMTYYKIKNSELPVTSKIGNDVVSLPMHGNLTDSDVSKIIEFTNKFI